MSFQTDGRSRQDKCTCNPMADRNFKKLENDLSRQVGLFIGGLTRQVSLYFNRYPRNYATWTTYNVINVGEQHATKEICGFIRNLRRHVVNGTYEDSITSKAEMCKHGMNRQSSCTPSIFQPLQSNLSHVIVTIFRE